MKNMKTRMTRLIVIFASLVMLLSTVVALPISAGAPGSDPILSETEYGITYDNGVYTINIDAERLAEILSSQSFNKETLKSILPEKVYDLMISRNKDAISALLSDLIDAGSYGQLKDDLPIDVIRDHFSAEDIISIVSIDNLMKVIDIKAIISSLEPDEIENIFKDGELDKLLKSLDLSGILTKEKLKAIMEILTPEEIEAALKPGAIERLIENDVVDLEALMTKENVEALFDESANIITDKEIEELIKNEKVVKEIIEDEAVLKQILHNPDFLKAVTQHPEIITDLMEDKVIVQIFIDHDLLHDFYDILSNDAETVKEIVLEKGIDISHLITPELISNLDESVIKSIISTEDIKKLAELIDEDDLRDIIKNNDCLDTSKIDFSHIYPQYITAQDIKDSGVISVDELRDLATLLSLSEKQAIGNSIDFADLDLSIIYKKDGSGYITDADIKDANVIDSSDVDILVDLLEDSEKRALVDEFGDNLDNLDFSVFFRYLTEKEIVDSGVLSDADYNKLATYISEDEKVTIAIDNDLIDITSIKDYLTTAEIMSFIDDADFDNLEGLLSSEEKASIAIDNDYIDFTKINFADLKDLITVDDIKNSGVVSDEDLKKLDADVFFDAGLTIDDIFDAVDDPAQLIIDLFNEGVITAEDVDFEQVISAVEKDEKAMADIVDEVMNVPVIKDHVTEMIMDEIEILADIVDHKTLYRDGIITNAMIFGGTDEKTGITYPGVISSDDIQKILDEEIINKELIFDSITDMAALVEEIFVDKLPFEKILEVFQINELVDEILKQNRQGLIDALDIPYLIRLDAVQKELRSLTVAEVKSIIDFDAVQNELIPKTMGLFLYNFEAIAINNHFVFVNPNPGKFDLAESELAMLDAFPTFDKIANVGDDGIIASYVIASSINGEAYYLGFKVRLTGDTTKIKEYATKVTDRFSFIVGDDGSINTKVKLPAKVAELYISAIDSSRVPAAIRNKLKDVANIEFNKSDISDIAEAIINKLTIAELKDVLSAVDVKNIDDKLLAQLDLRKSQVQIILDYAISGINKTVSILQNTEECESVLSTFYDKTIADFYMGNGTFNVQFDYFYDPIELMENVKDLPVSIKDCITNTKIEHHTDTTVTFEGLYSVEYIENGETFYTAFRTEGYDLNKVTTRPAFAGKGANGWGDADGNKVEIMPAADIELAKIYLATFKTQYANGTPVKDFVIPFTELSNAEDLVKKPEGIDIPHYELTWEPFTIKNEDFTVIGTYTPIDYTVTFMVDGEVYETRTYNIENLTITEPTVPAKKHYTGAWEVYDIQAALDSGNGDITVNAVYTPVTYTVTFVADKGEYGVETITRQYSIDDLDIDEPAVPARKHYTGAWEAYDLAEYLKNNDNGNITVKAIYTRIGYTVTFMVDGSVYATKTYNVENLTIEEPAVPTKKHFTAAWEAYDLQAAIDNDEGDITVNAVYTAVVYTVTFVADKGADGVETFTRQYSINNTSIEEPAVPTRKHYTGAWEAYDLAEYLKNNDNGNITVNAIYTPIDYTVTFMVDGNVYATKTYNVENLTIEEPAVPSKNYYTGIWEAYDLKAALDNGNDNITVNAIYTPITYFVRFMVDGIETFVREYTCENPSISEPTVPAKDGYTARWESYVIREPYADITVNAIYTEIGSPEDETYYITFYGENNQVLGRIDFKFGDSINDILAKAPAAPVKTGYNVYWPDYKNNIFNQDLFEQTGTYSFDVRAVYDIITYTATFWYGPNDFVEVKYTVLDLQAGTVKMPNLPTPNKGMSVRWSISAFALEDTDVTLIYDYIKYYITFELYNGVQYPIEFTILTDPQDVKPPVPPTAVRGYSAFWPSFELLDEDVYAKTGSYNQTIKAFYSLITYYVTFVDKDGNEVGKVPFTVQNGNVTPPAAPVLAGYNVSWPAFKALDDDRYMNTGTYNLTVRATYEIIKYSVTFMADGKEVAVRYYTVKNKVIDVPAVPFKEGFIGSWEAYTLDIGDKVVNAVYIADVKPETTFHITFVDWDGNVIEKIPFTINTDPSTIKAPATIPEKAGYNVYWPSFNLFDEDRFTETGTYSFTVKAVYEPIQYTATFVVDGKVIAEIPFTVETKSIDEPTIPAKNGYSASWSKYTLGTSDITINAVYSTISYSVTFIADGKEVAVLYYTVENPTIDEPAVPEKEGYSGKWEEYTLDIGNKEVHAIYTENATGEVEEEISIFWWIMLGVLAVAGIAVVVVYKAMTKKKKPEDK